MPPSSPPAQGMGAGALLIATLLFCAAIGLGVGALFGAGLIGTLVGAAIGFVAGMLLVVRAFSER